MNKSVRGRRRDHRVEATTSLVDRTLRTLKHDDLFGVFAKDGDCVGGKDGPDGLFYKDTRYLSHMSVSLGGNPLLLLSSVLLDDNGALIVDQTNADLHNEAGTLWLRRDTLFVERMKFLRETACYERILVRRFGPVPRPVPVEVRFASDFADLFEVRGSGRPCRGTTTAERIDSRSVRFVYRGLDERRRVATISFDPEPRFLTTQAAGWELDLTTEERCSIIVQVDCTLGDDSANKPPSLATAYKRVRKSSTASTLRLDRVSSSNELFNAVLKRSASDIQMLLTNTAAGLYPYAGVPWYSTVFGRDGIITAMMLLWIAPEIAEGVLEVLAAHQAIETDAAADSEPGKILHEMRSGEMAQLGEVPFLRYYGTIDATPLFVLLAGMYLKRTGDLATIRRLWPNIEAALHWIDVYGDRDRDGFVEYHRMSGRGLTNQGWKDSVDSIFHADGRLAEGPIALCEVQAYVFGAKMGAAHIADALGDSSRATTLRAEARDLRKRFEENFWDDELGTYVLALDGRKEPCRVLASNAGHALFSGIASSERAERVAKLLTGPRFFSGWGVRTVAVGEVRYNPMSYHNGSVWPHDNSLIALGLARYGHKAAVSQIFEGLVGAAFYDELHRLPELFCGFARRTKRGPTSYPVACSPQAWAAASPYALLAATTGIKLREGVNEVTLLKSILPPMLERLTLRGLSTGSSAFDLEFARMADEVTVTATNGPSLPKLVRAG